MFELVIRQKVKDKGYFEEQIYYSENLEDLVQLMKMTSALSRNKVNYLIREIEEGQIENED